MRDEGEGGKRGEVALSLLEGIAAPVSKNKQQTLHCFVTIARIQLRKCEQTYALLQTHS